MDNPLNLQPWRDRDGNPWIRNLVICDEGPSMTDIAPLDLSSLYAMASTVSDIKNFRSPDYLGYLWRNNIITPYLHLQSAINKTRKPQAEFGSITGTMMEEAGFCAENLVSMRETLQLNCNNSAVFHQADKVIDALTSDREKMYLVRQGKTTVFSPKLREPHGEGKPATFILDGTTQYNPELCENKNIEVLDCSFPINASRLTIHVQHSNRVSYSKRASKKEKNYAAILSWVRLILDNARGTHERVMVITYMKDATKLYKDLVKDYGDLLVPYTAKDGRVLRKLPYFGGTTGSNSYNRCTLIIMVGLNRFNPAEYLNRAIAIAGASEKWSAMADDKKSDIAQVWMDSMQAELLTNEIVQDMYRTDLRNHSSDRKIEVYLYTPPQATVTALQQQFPDAALDIISEIPEAAICSELENKMYGDHQDYGASVEQFLRRKLAKDPFSPITAKEIQIGAGIPSDKYYSAMRNVSVKKYYNQYFMSEEQCKSMGLKYGRGINRKHYPLAIMNQNT